jgi:hypothetical protein
MMTTVAFTLVLLGAFLHAAWNAAIEASSDKTADVGAFAAAGAVVAGVVREPVGPRRIAAALAITAGVFALRLA